MIFVSARQMTSALPVFGALIALALPTSVHGADKPAPAPCETILAMPYGSTPDEGLRTACLTGLIAQDSGVRIRFYDQLLRRNAHSFRLDEVEILEPIAKSPREQGQLLAFESKHASLAAFDKTLADLEIGIDAASARGDSTVVLTITASAAFLALRIGETERGRALLAPALTMLERDPAPALEKDIRYMLGIYEQQEGESAEAVEQYRRIISISEAIGDQNTIGTVKVNMASIMSELGDYDAGVRLNEEALALFDRHDIAVPSTRATIYNNIGNALTESGQHERALQAYSRSRDFIEISGKTTTLGYVNFWTAKSLFALGRRAEAVPLAETALQQTIADRSAVEAGIIDLWLAERHVEVADYASARAKLTDARRRLNISSDDLSALTEDVGDRYHAIIYAQTAARVARATGDVDEALRLSEVAQKLAETRFEEQRLRAVANLESLFEIRERDELIERMQQRLRIRELQAEQQKDRATLTAIAAAMAAFVAILLFFAWRAQRKAARTRATLLAEIHHRTKNNLQFITSLLNMDARRQRKNPSHAASPEDAAHRVQAMALLHDRLYAETDGHSVNLHEFLRAMLQQVEASFGRDDVEGTLNAPDIHLTPDTSAPMGLLVCELVLNAYKHAFPDRGGAILVEIEERGRELVLTVTDDGCGAKDGLRDGSVGMTLIEDLVAQLKGTAKMESGDWGTRWTISGIPAKRAVETV